LATVKVVFGGQVGEGVSRAARFTDLQIGFTRVVPGLVVFSIDFDENDLDDLILLC
jgi:hypothetical protein